MSNPLRRQLYPDGAGRQAGPVLCTADPMHSQRHCTKTLSAIGIARHENKTTYPLQDLLHKNSRLCADFS